MYQNILQKAHFTIPWEKHRHPWSGWSRVVLGLVSPLIIWSHDWLMIGLLVVALASNPYWFPVFKKKTGKLDIMTRLVDAEQWWIEQKSTGMDKAVLLFPGLVIGISMVAFLWYQYLFWGSFFFLSAVMYKLLFSQWVIDCYEAENSGVKTASAEKKEPAKKAVAKKTAVKKKAAKKTVKKSAKKKPASKTDEAA